MMWHLDLSLGWFLVGGVSLLPFRCLFVAAAVVAAAAADWAIGLRIVMMMMMDSDAISSSGGVVLRMLKTCLPLSRQSSPAEETSMASLWAIVYCGLCGSITQYIVCGSQ